MTDFQVLRFAVLDEPIWRFADQCALWPELPENIQIRQTGDCSVDRSPEGLQILLAVAPFDDFSMALSHHRQEWYAAAVAALREYSRRTSPQAALRLYRDPVDGVLRNLVE